MPDRQRVIYWVLFTGLSACLLIVAGAMMLGGDPVRQEGKAPAVRWRELSQMRRSTLPFHAGETLRYRVVWKGIPCAELRTSLRTERWNGRDWLVADYEGRTGAVINWAWTFSAAGETWVAPQTLLPYHSHRTSREKDKIKRSWTVFHRPGRSFTEVTVQNDDGEPEVARRGFIHGLDLPAAFLMIRALKMNAPAEHTLEVVHGDSAFALQLLPRGQETVAVPAGRFDALRVDVEMSPLGGAPEEREAQDQKYRGIRLWLTREERVPVRMEMDVVVGRVSLELTSME